MMGYGPYYENTTTVEASIEKYPKRIPALMTKVITDVACSGKHALAVTCMLLIHMI
jgi:hypothetical protein